MWINPYSYQTYTLSAFLDYDVIEVSARVTRKHGITLNDVERACENIIQYAKSWSDDYNMDIHAVAGNIYTSLDSTRQLQMLANLVWNDDGRAVFKVWHALDLTEKMARKLKLRRMR